MAKVIDVMEFQSQRISLIETDNPRVEYTKSPTPYLGAHFIMECGTKMNAKELTIATACSIFHKFFKQAQLDQYDIYVIGGTSLYLASKVEDVHVKVRDVVNVCYHTLHPDMDPLILGEDYWALRDSIVQAELLITRMLGFKLEFIHPHKYLLHYLVSLESWFGSETWGQVPIALTSWKILHDLYHEPVILDLKPQLAAISCIYLTLQCFGIEVPYNSSAVISWHEALYLDAKKEVLWDITDKILDVYEKESCITLSSVIKTTPK